MQVLVSLSFTRLAKVLVDKPLVSIYKKFVLALHPSETILRPISTHLLETFLWLLYLVIIIYNFFCYSVSVIVKLTYM
jgi:hypothetical protein